VKSDTANSGGPSTSARIVSKRNASTGFELYYHDADGELEFVANGSAANGGGSFAGQQWTWIAVTYDGTTATFYTGDGTTLSAGDSAALAKGAFAATTGELLIGNYNTGERPFSGLIDNVRIYNSVEDAASLQSIMEFDDTDLVFQMDFNDAEGNQSLTDRGTTSVTGSFAGTATYSETVAPFNTGGFSGAFATGSDAADFGDIDALDGLSAMTMTAWIKSSAVEVGGTVGSGRILAKRSGSGFELYYHNTDDEMEFVADGAGTTVFNGGGAIAVDQWVFLAVTWTGGTATFYTGDGTTLSAGDVVTGTAQTLSATNAVLRLGNNAAGDRLYQGLIDNVRIYKTVKDATSLQTIMQYNDAANAPEGPTVTLSTAANVVDSAYTVDVTFSADVSGLESSDFVVTNGTASGVSPATGPASSYTVTITPAALGPVTVQLPADSATDSESLPNLASNVLNTTADDPKRPITVRVAAYNVEFGKSATPEQIGALLLPYNLDIIGFNEAPDGDWTARVGAVLGMDYTFVGAISSANHVDKYKTILSRTPLEGTNEFTLTGSGWNPASAVRATTRIDGNSVAFYSLHISGNNGSTNSHAYKLATQVLPQETADRVIVVGDFNNRMGDYNINAIENAGFGAIWTDLNIDVTQEKTYDAQDPNTSHGVIDHIFYNTSASATVADGGIIEEDNPLSDHKPIWAVIAFPDDISINNPSFEAPKQASDGDTNTGAVSGWSESGGTIGNFNVSTDDYTTTDSTDSNGGVVGSMDSTNALYFASTANESVSQTLSESIVVGNTYELTVAVGDRDNGGDAGFAGYTLQLRDGDHVLKTVSSNASPVDGTFTDVVLTYTAQAGDSGALGITIGTTNAGAGRATDFDDVRLNYFYYTPAEQWRLLHFGSILNSGNGMYNFDADQDGLNNLIERAAGTDPNDASSNSMPSTSFSDINGDPGSDYITLSYRRLAGGTSSAGNDYTALGITYTLHTQPIYPHHGWIQIGSQFPPARQSMA
jgi:maltose 6'-phosphate phosphatase